jgi:hypothetical protein
MSLVTCEMQQEGITAWQCLRTLTYSGMSSVWANNAVNKYISRASCLSKQLNNYVINERYGAESLRT